MSPHTHPETSTVTHKTGQDLIDEAKQQIEEVTPEQVREMQVATSASSTWMYESRTSGTWGDSRAPFIFRAGISRRRSKESSTGISELSFIARGETDRHWRRSR